MASESGIILPEPAFPYHVRQDGEEPGVHDLLVGNIIIATDGALLPTPEQVADILRHAILMEASNPAYQEATYQLGAKSMTDSTYAWLDGKDTTVPPGLDCSGFTRHIIATVLQVDIGQGTSEQAGGERFGQPDSVGFSPWNATNGHNHYQRNADAGYTTYQPLALDSANPAAQLEDVPSGSLLFLDRDADGIPHVVVYMGIGEDGQPHIAEFSDRERGYYQGPLPDAYISRIVGTVDLAIPPALEALQAIGQPITLGTDRSPASLPATEAEARVEAVATAYRTWRMQEIASYNDSYTPHVPSPETGIDSASSGRPR